MEIKSLRTGRVWGPKAPEPCKQGADPSSALCQLNNPGQAACPPQATELTGVRAVTGWGHGAQNSAWHVLRAHPVLTTVFTSEET